MNDYNPAEKNDGPVDGMVTGQIVITIGIGADDPSADGVHFGVCALQGTNLITVLGMLEMAKPVLIAGDAFGYERAVEPVLDDDEQT